MTEKRQPDPPPGPRPGHNGGPPLEDEHVPEWGNCAIGTYFAWKTAHQAAWRNIPQEIMLQRLDRAVRLGLTYEEYTLEILERGHYLQWEDAERIKAIKRKRAPSEG